jgi:hypothetical protein
MKIPGDSGIDTCKGMMRFYHTNSSRSLRLFTLLYLLALSPIGTELNANPITWYIENAALYNGGYLTGSFEYDATTSMLSNPLLMTTQDGTVPPETWTNGNLYPGTGYAFSTGIQLVNDDVYGITLHFSSALTNSGGTSDLPLGGSLISGPLFGNSQTDLFQSGEVTTQVAALVLQGSSSSTPVFLPGAEPVAEVSGTIGAQGTQDYYTFLWTGGAFSASASVTGAGAGASYLFSEGAVGGCSSGGTATLNTGDSFTSTISVANLAPGQYCIGLDANNSNDPAFALTFNTPVDGVLTPEPNSFALLCVVGLAMVSAHRFARRRRQVRCPSNRGG